MIGLGLTRIRASSGRSAGRTVSAVPREGPPTAADLRARPGRGVEAGAAPGQRAEPRAFHSLRFSGKLLFGSGRLFKSQLITGAWDVFRVALWQREVKALL